MLRVRSFYASDEISSRVFGGFKTEGFTPLLTRVDTTLKSIPFAMFHSKQTEFHPEFVSENCVCYYEVSFSYTTLCFPRFLIRP